MKRKILSALVLCAVLIFSVSCGAQTLPDYRENAFFAELCYEINGLSVVCELTADAPKDAPLGRDLCARIILPNSPSEITVTRENGVYYLSQNGTVIESKSSASRLLVGALLIASDGELRVGSRASDSGERTFAVTVGDSGGDISLLCDGSGIPKSAERGGLRITVTRFEKR